MGTVSFIRCQWCSLPHRGLVATELPEPTPKGSTHQAVCPATQKPIPFRYGPSRLSLQPLDSHAAHLLGLS